MNVRHTRALGWTAAAAFLASWILPVLPGMRGWEAFRYALAPLIPFRDADPRTWEDSAPAALSALTNVVFVLLFVFGVWKSTMRPGLWVRVSIACFILNLYWFVKACRENGLADLLYGYYVWIAAFALLLILSVVAARRTSKTPTAGTPS
jgi:hypothetical protein